jgi:glycosyltransferase involved in cell wall biosynthesis
MQTFLRPRLLSPEEAQVWTEEPDGRQYAVAAIVPCYNAEKWVSESVRSVLEQSDVPGDLQVICVDDGSTDGTYSVLTVLQEHHDSLIVIRQPNRGASAARNRAIRRATAPILLYQDADDISPPDRLGLSLRAMQETGAELIYGQKLRFVTSPETLFKCPPAHPPSPNLILGGNGFGTGTVCVLRSVHMERGIWLDERLGGAEDHDLLIAALAAGISVVWSPEVLLWRRETKGSLRHRVDWRLLRKFLYLKHQEFLEEYTGKKVSVPSNLMPTLEAILAH